MAAPSKSLGQAVADECPGPTEITWGSFSSLNMSQKDPCQKEACEIQKCLQANNYMESKCEAVLKEMRKCCGRYPPGRSVCCSGFELEEKERQKQKSASKGTQGSHAE
ncbi:cx9C motif-containing protein 4 isoform X1 [Paroedura picta]|uniref:cx9C motif-containing protein 4 isoform X1 n=2 Tax=Paroedura picta TaxID=143630 RepID=UPI0040575B96